MRNYFNIVRSVGLIFFGIGTFILSIISEECINRLRSVYNTKHMWEDGLAFFLILGCCFLIAGLAGLMKAKWFPKGGIVVLVFAFFSFSWFMFTEIIQEVPGQEEFLWACALIGLTYVMILSFVLLLNNEYFLDALAHEDIKPDDGRILDA